MKSSSPSNPQKTSPLMNLAIIVVLLLTALPIALFAFVQIYQPSFGSANTVSTDTAAKRPTAAERRADCDHRAGRRENPAGTAGGPGIAEAA